MRLRGQFATRARPGCASGQPAAGATGARDRTAPGDIFLGAAGAAVAVIGLLAAAIVYVSPSQRSEDGEIAQYQAVLKCAAGEKLVIAVDGRSFYDAWETAVRHRPGCRVRRVVAREPEAPAAAAGNVSAN